VTQARALAATGTLAAVIVIPAGFSARVQAGRPASIEVIGNVDAPISTEIAWSIAESYTADLNRIRLSVAALVHSTVPPGYDGAVRTGRTVNLRYLARPDQSSQQLGEAVRGVVARQAALLGAARFAVTQHAAPGFDAGLAATTRIAPAVPSVSVTQTTAGPALSSRTLGQFDEGAWTELLLFLFLTAMTGAVALIETRRLGVAAVVILYALVGAGAGIFVGTLFRNEPQAIGVSLLLGLGLGALGGCMVPLCR